MPGSLRHAQLVEVQGRATRSFEGTASPTHLDQWFALGGLFALLMLNIALPVWKVSAVPVRGLFALVLLGALACLYPRFVARAVRENGKLLGVVAGLALIGIFVSIVNGAPAGDIAQAVIEMPLQAAVMIILAFSIAYICGARACMIAIVGAIAISGLAAVLQAAGVDAAWDFRRWLGALQAEEEILQFGKNRPVGLSFSPIQLATQLCLAFAAYMAVRDKERSLAPRADPTVVLALLVFAALSVASGTRSPVLGGLLFFALYATQRRGLWFAFLMMMGGIAAYLLAPLVMETIQSTQPRVVKSDDNSATGRASLFTFGLMLFRDNPLGYGFGFSPTEHWTDYWQDLYTLPSAAVVQSKQLHNYALNMLNTYGIGLLLLAPAVIGLLRRGRASLIFFIPYIVHIGFHNSGPLWNDMVVWFAIAAISVAGQKVPATAEPKRAAHSRRPRAQALGHRAHGRPYAP